MTAPRFLALCTRTMAYRGVMRERLQVEAEASEPARTPTYSAPAASEPAGNAGDRMVSPDEMRSMFPDLFAQGGGDPL